MDKDFFKNLVPSLDNYASYVVGSGGMRVVNREDYRKLCERYMLSDDKWATASLNSIFFWENGKLYSSVMLYYADNEEHEVFLDSIGA